MTDQNPTPRIRLFVAIPIPEPVRDEIIHIQRELELLSPHGAIRWTRPDQIHLTLRFLGGVPAVRVEALKESISASCRGVRLMRLRAEGIGFFPNAHSPRVIWAGINEAEGLLAGLQKEIETAVRPFTTEPAAENFVGHATLGRFKRFRRSEMEKLLVYAQTIKSRMFGEWPAQEVEIIQSQLSSNGAHYTMLAAFRLDGKG